MKILISSVLSLALALVATGLWADDKPAGQVPPSIDALLEGLGDESAGAEANNQPADKPARGLIIDGEDIGAAPQDDNPLASIGRQMRQVKQRIGDGDTADETQFMQKQIVSDLDKLLDELNKQCQGGKPQDSSSNSSPKPGSGKPQGGNQPGEKSNRPNAQGSEEGIRKAEAAEETSADPRTVVREAWGHLPERLREQVQAAAFERFLPQYEELIEAYYERLADENASP